MIDPRTFLQIFLWDRTRPVSRTQPWTGFLVRSENQYRQANGSVIIVYLVVAGNDKETYTTYSLPDGTRQTRILLTYSGEIQLQSWSSRTWVWEVFSRWPSIQCNRYGYCGAYGTATRR